MKRRQLLPRLRRDDRGISAVEFGLIGPVVVLLLLGALDMGHTLYMQSVLQGALQKAGRDSSLETGTETAKQTSIDGKVRASVQSLAKDATVTISRRFFRDYTKAAQAVAEPYTDTNANGTCDAGEPYQDNNNNSSWDKDGGDAGQGGAKDTVVYTADVSYPRLFPMAKLMGLPANVQIRASTFLVNQPYGDQDSYSTPVARNCP